MLAAGEARRNKATLPIAALVDQFYAEVQTMGGARRYRLSEVNAYLQSEEFERRQAALRAERREALRRR